MRQSALYEGTVFHRRAEPRPHRFEYRLFMVYLDLDELPDLFAGSRLWSMDRPNLVWFRRRDYMGPADRPLKEAVLDRVEGEIGRRPGGAVRMLTHLRTFGYVFNPVTFYYCFDAVGELDAIAAEITNTPWRERHTYVLDARKGGAGDELRWRFAKRFHVSPFFDMDQTYHWSFHVPGPELTVRMINEKDGRAVFTAGLRSRRRELTRAEMRRVLLRHPLLTLRIHAAIYWQAARLWWKRTPFFTHPRKRAALASTSDPRS